MLRELARVSALFGAEPDYVQGQGGNTSLKDGDVLWIKASGMVLAEAETRSVFVPVDRAEVRAATAARDAVRLKASLRRDLAVAPLLPSIETAMHEALPHRAVFHGHPVNVLARIVTARIDRAGIGRRLDGLRWSLVPYATPGLPLTAAILRAPPADVYLLRNHGLVVGADDPEAAFDLYREVERRLGHEGRPSPSFRAAGGDDGAGRADANAPVAGFEPLRGPWVEAFARDAGLVRRLERPTLYPDHVVFLGPGIPIAERASSVPVAARFDWCAVPGEAIYGRIGRNPGVDAMVEALARVALRLPEGAPIASLSDRECARLSNWDMEAYRRSLRAGSATGATSPAASLRRMRKPAT